MKMLQPHTTFEPYKTFVTCQIEAGLLQLSKDCSCQVLLADFQTRKFTIEERSPIPHKANWYEAAIVALPGSKVMIIGLRWDQYSLTPWVYDLKENIWSNKLAPDGETLPSLPDEFTQGSAIYLKNKVYFVHISSVWILDLSTLERWQRHNLAQDHGNGPVVVLFSPSEVGIVGGYGSEKPEHNITIFDTQTGNSSQCADQVDDELGVQSAEQQSVVVSGQQAFSIALDKHRNLRLIEIILQDGRVTYKTVAPLAEAENKAIAVRVYDPNYALKLSGLKELTPAQLELFEAYWNSFVDILLNASQDDVLFWIMKYGGETRTSMKHGLFKRDDYGCIAPIHEHEQQDLCVKAWKFSLACFESDFPQPETLRNATLKAMRSLNPGTGNDIDWADFKRCYLIMDTWLDRGRVECTVWAHQIMSKEK